MSASKVLSVKISADAQIRRFTIPAEGTAAAQYEALQKVLRENYSDKLKAGAALKFADDEGDYCVLSSAAEFAEAVRLLGNPPATLKLFLTATAAAPAAPAPAPAPAAAAKPAAAPAPAPAAKPAAAAAAPAPAKVYPVLPAKPAAPAPAPAKPAAAAAAAPAKPVAAAAPKVEAAPKPAAAAKAAPVPAPAAPKKEETPKAADAKAAAAAAAAAAADAPKDEWEAKREKCRAFRKQLHATVSDAKVRAALKELVAPAIQAVEAIANGSDKRSLSAVLTALVTGSPVLAANEFVAKTLLPRGVEKLERVDALVRPFLPAVVPFLPLAAVHLPDQIDRLAERLEQREKFAEQWRAAKAAGVAGKGTDCKSRGAFGKAFGCGGPFMRGGCGPFGLLRTLFRGTAEAGAEGKDGEDAAACGGFPKELKDLFRALRGHGPHVPRDGHHGHHWRRHGGCHRSRSRDNKEEATAAAGTAAGASAAAADKAAAPEKTADGKVIHYQVTCDGCGVSPITGVRYKCQVCRNFDLCEACEAGAAKHPADHALLKIRVSHWNADGRRNRSPAPAAPTGPAVHHVICDGCNASPIVGVRYKCQTCPDFDLCAKCEEAGKHSEHTFLKMKSADVAPAARGGRHGHGHGHRFGGHGHHHGPHPHGPFGFPFGPFAFGAGPHGPHRHPHPHSPRGWGRRFGGFGAGSASGSGSGSGSGSSGSDSESDQARAVAALVADLLAQNPFLASAIEGVEVRNAAPDSADPNTASVPLNAAAGPAALLAALLPAVFTKQTAAKAAAAPVPKTADASTATATAAAPAAVAKDEKGEPVNKPAVAATATAAAAPAKPVTPVTGGKKAEREAARASKVDADVEALKAMGFTGHPDDVLRQLLTVAEVKKHRRFHSNVQWVVDALLSGDADKYL